MNEQKQMRRTAFTNWGPTSENETRANERPLVLAIHNDPRVLAEIVETLEDEFIIHAVESVEAATAVYDAQSEFSVLVYSATLSSASLYELLLRARAVSQVAAIMVADDPYLEEPLQPLRQEFIFGILVSSWTRAQLRFTVFSAHNHSRLLRALSLEQRLLQGLLDNTRDLVCYRDRSGRIIRANRRYAEACGGSQADALVGQASAGRLPAELVPAPYDLQADEQVLRSGRASHGEDISLGVPSSTNSLRRLSTVRVPVYNDWGAVVGVLSISREMTVQSADKDTSRQDAGVDGLTRTANRNELIARLEEAVAAAKLNGHAVAVLSVGIDHFSSVMASFGYAVGSEILKHVAQTIKAQVPDGATVGRPGGGEFVVLLGSASEAEAVAAMTRRILGALAAPCAAAGRRMSLTASAGICLYSVGCDADSASTLLRNASMACLEARRAGGNQYRFYRPEMNAAVERRALVENALHGALELGQFMLYYQPRVSLRDGAIVGMEALLRWPHPDLGMVPPLEFIPLAEESDLILRIGEWVIREACRQLRAWRDTGLQVPPLAINLSARQFRSKRLREVIIDALAASAVPPSLLEIEITEATAMVNIDEAVQIMRELKTLGVSLAIDDFGTGYSSLAYLKRFPIDCLKLDRAFVREVDSTPQDAAICIAVIQLAHSLRIRVVAEGVEGESQMAYLRRHGCDEMQGFYFSRPVEAGAIARMLRDGTCMAAGATEAPSGQPTLLLVDDEPHVLNALKRVLRGERYRILTAASAREGFEILARHTVHVLVSDERMPEMSGTQFLERVKDLHPGTVRMVLSGYAHVDAITRAINNGAISKFLLKPWNDDELRQTIREAFSRLPHTGMSEARAGSTCPE